jgi:hypothetical protein
MRWTRWYPEVLAVLAGVLYFGIHLTRTYKMPQSANDLMGATVNLCAIAVGFLATAKAILISVDDKRLIADLKDTGHYREIVRYLRCAITWAFMLACWSAAGLFLDIGRLPTWTKWYAAGTAVWVASGVGTFLSCHRVIHVFYVLLERLGSGKPVKQP